MNKSPPNGWQPSDCGCLFVVQVNLDTAATEFCSCRKRCEFHSHSSLTDKELFTALFMGLTDDDLKGGGDGL
jgi:hypothetical protein